MSVNNVSQGVSIGLDQRSIALVDQTAWGQSISGLAVDLNGTANQFGLTLEGNDSLVTGAGASYEKAMLLVIANTADPSGANTLDMVGIDTRGYIAATNATGRTWGLYAEGRIVTGGTGDGYLVGGEIVSNNNGTDQPSTGTATSKVGLHLVAAGTNPSTVAMYIGGTPRGAGSSQTWHKGLFMETASLAGGASDSFLELQSTWRVVATTANKGQTLIGSATAQYSSTMLEIQGANATADPFVQVGSTSFNQAYSISVQNGTGRGALAIATGGGFLSDAVLGDTVLTTFTTGKSIRIGGTSTVLNITRANTFGAFGAAAVAQPSAVGTATGYTAGATAATFHSDDTYTGNTGTTGYTINGIVAALKQLGWLHT